MIKKKMYTWIQKSRLFTVILNSTAVLWFEFALTIKPSITITLTYFWQISILTTSNNYW